MNTLLSALETEYGFAAWDRQGDRIPFGRLQGRFKRLLKNRYSSLPAVGGGDFLGTGGRLYWDAGEHPEYASPECAGHPKELVAYVRAGHRLLADLVAGLREDRRIGFVRAWRGNIDYQTGQTWGCHENYLVNHKTADLAPELIAHLVSRVIYGGAGGFSPHDPTRFSLSPRLELFEARETLETMHSRGIINTRAEHHAKDKKRLHLICRDNVVSETADLLSIGMTRLVVALADQDRHPAGGLLLDDAVAALQGFCTDPSCRLRARTSAGRLSAVDIQRKYLDGVGNNLHRLPEWAVEIVDRCDRVLDALAGNPEDLSGILDWPTKQQLFLTGDHLPLQERLMQDTLLSDLESPFDEFFRAQPGGSIVVDSEIETAIRKPPSTTRARIRGAVVERLSGREDVICDWSRILGEERHLDLADPFETDERWIDKPLNKDPDPNAAMEIPAFLRRRS